MKARASHSEIQGYFCPLFDRALLDKRLRNGSMQFTHSGLEKRCPRCREFWPFDTEFFFSNRSVIDGVYQWCRACYVETRWPDGRPVATPQLEAA